MDLGVGPLLRRWYLKPSTILGYALILLAAAFAALFDVLAKPMLESVDPAVAQISPVTLVAIIYLTDGLFFTPLAKKTGSIKNIGHRNMIYIILIGIAEVSALTTNFFGLTHTSVVNASILGNGEIIFSVVIAATIFREKLRRNEITPFSMIIIGAVLIPVGYDIYDNGFAITQLVFADLLIVISGLIYAADINISKFLSDKVDARRITQLSSFSGCAFAFSLILVFQIPFDVDPAQLPKIIFMGIFSAGLSSMFFIVALKLIGAIRAILLYSTTTVFGVFFAAIFLQETITLTNVLSIGMVMIGIYLLRNRLARDEEEVPSKDIFQLHLNNQESAHNMVIDSR